MKKILLLLAVTLTAVPVLADEGEYLTYDDFIRQVEAGIIQSVTLDKFSSITGEQVFGDTTNTFRSYADTGSANDPLLVRFLKEHGVTVSMSDESDSFPRMPFISGFIFMGTPIVFLIFLVVIIMKLNQILTNQQSFQQLLVAYSVKTADAPTGNTQE